jgi:tetratricopeptide (TPR) repeat protein
MTRSVFRFVLGRAALFLLIVVVVQAALLTFSADARTAAGWAVQALIEKRGAGGTMSRLDDRSGLIAAPDMERFDNYLAQIETETGIDIRLLFATPPAGESLEHFAAAQAERLGIGRENGSLRGLLYVFDPATERSRVELGYGLEEYFPDSFLGYLIERHASTFFRAGDPTTGIRLLVRVLHERIRDEMLGGTFDPAPFEGRERSGFVSGGGGASAATPLGRLGIGAFREPQGGFRGDFPPQLKRHFGPQPTPEAAYRRYLEWLATPRFDPQVDLFTAESRELLDGFPATPPYKDHIVAMTSNRRYEILERGDMAMLYYTSTPLLSPVFLRRSGDGWRIDSVEDVRNSREIAGAPWTWTLANTGESTARFGDRFVSFGGVVHVRGGDNRPLPVPRSEAATPPREAVLPEALLTEPSLPERDVFGYPTLDVDPREVLALLRDRRFAELDAFLVDQQNRALRDFRYEFHLRAAYAAFSRGDPELESLLNDWSEQRPASVPARLARAEYYLARAWESRGTAWMRDTPRENVRGMRDFAARASADAAGALQSDPRQLMGYSILIRTTQLTGGPEESRAALRRGLRASPYSFMLRTDIVAHLEPKLGGSYGEVEFLAEEAQRYAEINPRLRALRGYVHLARGDALERGKQRQRAITEYTRALEYGDNWRALLDRAQAYFREDDYARAITDLNRAWPQRPAEPEILEWRGKTYLALAFQGTPVQRNLLLARAVRDLTLAQEIDPDRDRARVLRMAETCRADPVYCGGTGR